MMGPVGENETSCASSSRIGVAVGVGPACHADADGVAVGDEPPSPPVVPPAVGAGVGYRGGTAYPVDPDDPADPADPDGAPVCEEEETAEEARCVGVAATDTVIPGAGVNCTDALLVGARAAREELPGAEEDARRCETISAYDAISAISSRPTPMKRSRLARDPPNMLSPLAMPSVQLQVRRILPARSTLSIPGGRRISNRL